MIVIIAIICMGKAASVSAPLLFNITDSEHSTKINIPILWCSEYGGHSVQFWSVVHVKWFGSVCVRCLLMCMTTNYYLLLQVHDSMITVWYITRLLFLSCHSTSVSSFKSSLKTFLFSKNFSSVPLPWYKTLCVCVCVHTCVLYVLNLENM